VQQMAQKYIAVDKLTIVVVGDRAKVTGQVAPYQKSGE